MKQLAIDRYPFAVLVPWLHHLNDTTHLIVNSFNWQFIEFSLCQKNKNKEKGKGDFKKGKKIAIKKRRGRR